MTAPTPTGRFRRLLRIAAKIFAGVLWFGLTAWAMGAIHYSNLPWAWLRNFGAIAFALGTIAVFVWARPTWRARLIFLAAWFVILAWFLLIPPSNQRNWRPDVVVLPYAEIVGDRLSVHNIRNCDYRTETDYTVRHYDRVFDLFKLESVDLFLVHWGSPAIAHTMLSFGFADGNHLCFSIETRMEQGESYSAIAGFFRQYEITYVMADERDLVRLRTNYRVGEEVYIYRLHSDLAKSRKVLLDYLARINRLKEKPEWYNAATDNCTTSIHQHTFPYFKKIPWDWRILVNGYLDELLYETGSLDTSVPFAELQTRSHINARAKAADTDPEFATRIRAGSF
ncbi:MAG: DUF4105 domain-containing protein [Nibricoccus sp.]